MSFATTALIAAACMVAIGVAILWANPARPVNRAVFVCALTIVAWLTCWHLAVAAPPGKGLTWVLWTTSIGSLVAPSYWLVKEVGLAPPDLFSLSWFRRHWAWVVVATLLAVVPFTDSFIPPASTPDHRLYGPGYYAYAAGSFLLYFLLLKEAAGLRTLADERRVELQTWIVGGACMFLVIESLMLASLITGNALYRHCEPIVVLLFYGAVAYAMTAHRVFDARQIMLIVLQKAVLAAIIVLTGLLAFAALRAMPVAYAVAVSAALAGAAGLVAQRWLDRTFSFYPETHAVRHAVIAAAARETQTEALISAFHRVLRGWGQAEHALFVCRPRGVSPELDTDGDLDNAVIGALRQMRWVTSERLGRERASKAHAPVQRFMAAHRLAVVVIADGPAMVALVGAGRQASRRPYTYPQVQQLTEIASIMESAYERAHFSAKARHAEQLATLGLLGASVAHEIQNPLVAIRTFVQMLPAQHGNPAFREKFFELIAGEVQRIDQLTRQLLDLASPRMYAASSMALHPVIRSTLTLVEAKAAARGVTVHAELAASPDTVQTDAAAVKQVVLNLCFNAIQAMDKTPVGQRHVRVVTARTEAGVELSVSDTGPGISPEIRSRLFEHFRTTKSSGFGLGLAICRDILDGLGATIRVDPARPGNGATFRVVFPAS